MFHLSEKSIKNLEGVNPWLKKIVTRAIELSEVDFGVLSTGGFRTADQQNEIFKSGNSRCDGYVKKSKHQLGEAVDTVAYINGKYSWSNKLAYIKIYEALQKAEEELKVADNMPQGLYIHHGMFWKWKDLDNNGKLSSFDQLGWDVAHHEINDYPQNI